MDCLRTEEEIMRVENWAVEGINEGSRFSGMSYEQGILDTLDWLQRLDAHAPDETD